MDNIEKLLLEMKESLERTVKESQGNLERLVFDVKESLEREVGALRQDVHEGFTQLKSSYDLQAARLDRHAGLWQAGSRWSSRMDAWAEKVDGALAAKDKEIAELRERLIKLERKSA